MRRHDSASIMSLNGSSSFERMKKSVSFSELDPSPTKGRSPPKAVPVRRSIFLPEWLNKMEESRQAAAAAERVASPSMEETDNWLARALSGRGPANASSTSMSEVSPPSSRQMGPAGSGTLLLPDWLGKPTPPASPPRAPLASTLVSAAPTSAELAVEALLEDHDQKETWIKRTGSWLTRENSWPRQPRQPGDDDRLDASFPMPPTSAAACRPHVGDGISPAAPIIVSSTDLAGMAVEHETTPIHTPTTDGAPDASGAFPPMAALACDVVSETELIGTDDSPIAVFAARVHNNSLSLHALGCGVIVGQEIGYSTWDQRVTLDVGAFLVTLCGAGRPKSKHSP